MKKPILAVLFIALFGAGFTAGAGEPCCSIVAINAKTGVVSVKNVTTGKIIKYKAQPTGIRGLKVGNKVDLVSGKLRTAAGEDVNGDIDKDLRP